MRVLVDSVRLARLYTVFFHLALQGAARMALQPDAHPAQIKDSVASELE